MSYRKYLLLNFFLIFFLFRSAGIAAELRVAVSIAPVHSLVASVMKGVRQPDLIVRQNVSPHSYHLSPSKAFLLSKADLVFWIGKDFERSLYKVMKSLPGTNVQIALGGAGCTASAKHADFHIWLNPKNAITMVQHIAAGLVQADAENAALYRQNADHLVRRLKRLDSDLKARLAPLKGKHYLVFHDAYTCFEQRYGLKSAGFFRALPHRLPGAGHVRKLRRKIMEGNIECIFTEPGFTPAQIRSIVKETGLKTGVLDPLGVGLQPGPELYFKLMQNLARSLRYCLEGR